MVAFCRFGYKGCEFRTDWNNPSQRSKVEIVIPFVTSMILPERTLKGSVLQDANRKVANAILDCHDQNQIARIRRSSHDLAVTSYKVMLKSELQILIG